MSTTTDDTDDGDTVTVVSQFRPFPRAAMKQLRNAHGVIETERVGDPGRQEIAVVASEPDEDFLDLYELAVDPEYTEVWETTGETSVVITDRRVTSGGTEATLSSEKAARKVRDSERFSLVSISGESPFADPR